MSGTPQQLVGRVLRRQAVKQQNLEHLQQTLGWLSLVQKEGREFSDENLSYLQAIHDTLVKMTGGRVCQGQGSISSTSDEAAAETVGGGSRGAPTASEMIPAGFSPQHTGSGWTDYQRALSHTTKRPSTTGKPCMIRWWPQGVGGKVEPAGVRPPLTNQQRRFMNPAEWTAYESGGAVEVPEY